MVLIGGDLNAVARVEAACVVSGRVLRRADPDRLAETPTGPIALVLVDLDEAPSAPEQLREAGLLSPTSPPVVGFFSHVDTEVGRRAAAAGIRAVPRGRFWRELQDTIAALPHE